jgi:hypothetical protein
MSNYYYIYTKVLRPLACKSHARIFSLAAGICLCFQVTAQTSASADPANLLEQRSALIEQAQSTRELDQQLFNLGYRPKAIIATEVLENGSKRITFPTYLLIPEERKQRIIDRLTSHYLYLLSMEIDTGLREVTFLVPAATSQEELTAIFDHFGYLGYEEH